ncbi:MAG TPA: hypothetical protein VGB45_10635 [Abditibacterium sp.]|jgi:hypothetical protein
MGMAIGFLLFLLGAVTFVGWLPETFYFLKGMVSFSLLFWGSLALLMGISERRAKRQFEKALGDETPQTTQAQTESENSN